MTQTWESTARSLRIGSKTKVACCSADRSATVSNSHAGVSLYCHRCRRSEFHPHGLRSIQEIMAARRALDALAARPVCTMPEDAVPLPEGPLEAWQWVLRGGLAPEAATAQHGMRWHEPTRRVLIPIYTGPRCTALLGRAVFGERPKYRMVAGRADCFFRAPGAPGVVVVTEDVLSALAVARSGVSAVAVLGTAITAVHAAEIASGGGRVIGWFDGDAAGEKAWQRLRRRMALYPVQCTRITTRQDPKELHRAALTALLQSHIGA